jgi:photosystem II stability/assembly factor-like uncharacterized protein
VYRSDDAGDSWQNIGSSLPSDFGFPVVVSPDDPDTAYVLPLTSDEFRCTVDGQCRVFRTADGGGSWEPLTKGLPQEDAYLTVLRDGFSAGGPDEPGLFFGTRTGEVFASRDGGERWDLAAAHLPPVQVVRAV